MMSKKTSVYLRRGDKNNHTVPYLYTFITLRYESFGAIAFNQHMGTEVLLDRQESYVAGLCNGMSNLICIEESVKKRFDITTLESKRRVDHAIDKLNNIYAIGFLDDVVSSTPIEPLPATYEMNGLYLSAPRTVTWEVTSACNLRCPHCLNDSGKALEGDLDTKQALSIIDELAKNQVFTVLISGGEPLLRPDILTLLRYLSSRKIRPEIATNGVELPEEIVIGLRNLPVYHAHVSIDGIGAKHDRFRGRKGAFDASCKTIRRLQEEGIAVSISTTVSAENIDDLDRIIDLAVDLGCRGLLANSFIPSGRGRQNTERLKLKMDDYYHLYKKLYDKSKELEGKLEISSDLCYPFLFSETLNEIIIDGPMGCSAGHDIVCISSNGTVYACPFMRDFPLGNLMERPLKDIWNHAPVLETLRTFRKRDMHEPCKNCRYAPIQCKGGCRAAAFIESGDLMSVDPTCFKSII
jgi:radical SAM protein with 4Fe4S-binding SPASM domain